MFLKVVPFFSFFFFFADILDGSIMTGICKRHLTLVRMSLYFAESQNSVSMIWIITLGQMKTSYVSHDLCSHHWLVFKCQA